MTGREGLFALIDRLSRRAAEADYAHTVHVEHGASGHWLALAVGADRSFVQFGRGDDPERNPWESRGDGAEHPVLIFYFGGHYSEVPDDMCVPTEAALEALGEFAATGDRPGKLRWERAW